MIFLASLYLLTQSSNKRAKLHPPAEPGPAPCRGCLQKELPRAADPFAPICPDCHYQGELDDGCPAAECLECHPASADQSPDDQTELTQAAD